MARKKTEEKEEEAGEALAAEVEVLSPAPVESTADAIKQRVTLIVSAFSEITEVEGVPFDRENQQHRLIAAWQIGRRGILRR